MIGDLFPKGNFEVEVRLSGFVPRPHFSSLLISGGDPPTGSENVGSECADADQSEFAFQVPSSSFSLS